MCVCAGSGWRARQRQHSLARHAPHRCGRRVRVRLLQRFRGARLRPPLPPLGGLHCHPAPCCGEVSLCRCTRLANPARVGAGTHSAVAAVVAAAVAAHTRTRTQAHAHAHAHAHIVQNPHSAGGCSWPPPACEFSVPGLALDCGKGTSMARHAAVRTCESLTCPLAAVSLSRRRRRESLRGSRSSSRWCSRRTTLTTQSGRDVTCPRSITWCAMETRACWARTPLSVRIGCARWAKGWGGGARGARSKERAPLVADRIGFGPCYHLNSARNCCVHTSGDKINNRRQLKDNHVSHSEAQSRSEMCHYFLNFQGFMELFEARGTCTALQLHRQHSAILRATRD